MLGALEAALQPDAPLASRLTEKGTLQLLFDLRCLHASLAGAAPLPPLQTPSDPSENSPNLRGDAALRSGTALRARAADLEQALSQRLDPIDWATYESYLWAAQAACMRQKSLLLGLLMQDVPGHEVRAPFPPPH